MNIYFSCCQCCKNKNKFKHSDNNKKENNNNKDNEDKKNKKKVILLNTGALNPVHKEHIINLKLAQDCLENHGFIVEKSYLSPSHDNYLNMKKKDNDIYFFYNFEDRLKMCNLALKDFKKEKNNDKYNIEISDWECKQQDFIDYPDVFKHFEDENKDKIVFYICGSDNYTHVQSNIDNVVVIKRNNDTVNLRKNKNHFIVNDNNNADFSSTKARNLIKNIENNNEVDKNKKDLEKYLYPSVIDYILKIKKKN